MNNEPQTFDSQLVATVGEEVYYLNQRMEVALRNGGKVSSIYVNKEKIEKCRVIEILYSTNNTTCIKALTEHGEKVIAVQELFFRSLEEARIAADIVNDYSNAHEWWEHPYVGADEGWYEIYLRLFRPKYSYLLQFPVKPNQVWLTDEDGKDHIVNKIIAYIGEDEVYIRYQEQELDELKDGVNLTTMINPFKVLDQAYQIIQIN